MNICFKGMSKTLSNDFLKLFENLELVLICFGTILKNEIFDHFLKEFLKDFLLGFLCHFLDLMVDFDVFDMDEKSINRQSPRSDSRK